MQHANGHCKLSFMEIVDVSHHKLASTARKALCDSSISKRSEMTVKVKWPRTKKLFRQKNPSRNVAKELTNVLINISTQYLTHINGKTEGEKSPSG